MNLLDENFPDDQRSLLRGWRIPFRQIGLDAGHFGVKDDNIIPLLHAHRRATFFTQPERCNWDGERTRPRVPWSAPSPTPPAHPNESPLSD